MFIAWGFIIAILFPLNHLEDGYYDHYYSPAPALKNREESWVRNGERWWSMEFIQKNILFKIIKGSWSSFCPLFFCNHDHEDHPRRKKSLYSRAVWDSFGNSLSQLFHVSHHDDQSREVLQQHLNDFLIRIMSERPFWQPLALLSLYVSFLCLFSKVFLVTYSDHGITIICTHQAWREWRERAGRPSKWSSASSPLEFRIWFKSRNKWLGIRENASFSHQDDDSCQRTYVTQNGLNVSASPFPSDSSRWWRNSLWLNYFHSLCLSFNP